MGVQLLMSGAGARQTRMPLYERALYGTLTGYLPAVLPVCRTWEDHIWARINARIEARSDRLHLASSGALGTDTLLACMSQDRPTPV